MKEGSKMILLDKRHHRSAVRQLKAKSGHEWTLRVLCFIQVIRRDEQAVGRAETIKSSRMKKTFKVIVSTYRSFLSVTKAVLDYMGAFELQH